MAQRPSHSCSRSLGNGLACAETKAGVRISGQGRPRRGPKVPHRSTFVFQPNAHLWPNAHLRLWMRITREGGVPRANGDRPWNRSLELHRGRLPNATSQQVTRPPNAHLPIDSDCAAKTDAGFGTSGHMRTGGGLNRRRTRATLPSPISRPTPILLPTRMTGEGEVPCGNGDRRRSRGVEPHQIVPRGITLDRITRPPDAHLPPSHGALSGGDPAVAQRPSSTCPRGRL